MLGRDGNCVHHSERERLDVASARLGKDLSGQVGATAATAGATGQRAQILERRRAFAGGGADHLVGDGIADTDVHGLRSLNLRRPSY